MGRTTQHQICTLPPNTTHLSLPLDVAEFWSVKRLWKKMLNDRRKKIRTQGSVPKSHFPEMFKQVRANLRSENLVAGFRSSGICPIDCNQMLKKIPGANRDSGGPETNSERNESVKALLRSHCGIAVKQ